MQVCIIELIIVVTTFGFLSCKSLNTVNHRKDAELEMMNKRGGKSVNLEEVEQRKGERRRRCEGREEFPSAELRKHAPASSPPTMIVRENPRSKI